MRHTPRLYPLSRAHRASSTVTAQCHGPRPARRPGCQCCCWRRRNPLCPSPTRGVRCTISRPGHVGELGRGWLERKRGHLKPSAYRSYENAWRVYVQPRYGAADESQLSVLFATPGCRLWVAELSAKLSASRVTTVYSVLAGILGDAVRDRKIAANPARGVKLPRRTQAAECVSDG